MTEREHFPLDMFIFDAAQMNQMEALQSCLQWMYDV